MLNNKLLVLIVDDSFLMIEKIKELLRDCEGIGSLISASDYDEAIRLIDSAKPDVALLDINLPYKSGIEILRYIRHNNYPVKVIMLTNQGSDRYEELCKKIGSDHFLDKSTDFDNLFSILSAMAPRTSIDCSSSTTQFPVAPTT